MIPKDKRAVVFAHYDKLGGIEDYVIYYLKELKKIADKVIFVSDADIDEDETAKIKDIADYIITGRHGEYDFGSYKRGYIYLKENGFLEDVEELIFANDSCYGPIYPLNTVFSQIENQECDFWGMNFNDVDVKPHIQSFFMVLKKQVFENERFDDFMMSICREANKDDVVEKYEIGLSQMLFELGFTANAFIKSPIDREISYNIVFRRNNPLIKTCAADKVYKIFIKQALNGLSYPENLIFDAKRYNQTQKTLMNNIKFLRKIIIKMHIRRREIFILNQKITFKKGLW